MRRLLPGVAALLLAATACRPTGPDQVPQPTPSDPTAPSGPSEPVAWSELRVETPWTNQAEPLQVVLGKGPTARVQPLGSDGSTVFQAPGAGPFTVSVVSKGHSVWVQDQVSGPLVRFVESLPKLAPLALDFGRHQSTFRGKVQGAQAGSTVTVDVILDGTRYDEIVVAADGTFSAVIEASGQQPIRVRWVATEWAGGQMARMGTALVSSSWTHGDLSADITLDEPFDQTLEVIVQGKDPASNGLWLEWEVELDGVAFRPHRSFATHVPSGNRGTLRVPRHVGALQDAKAILTVTAGSPSALLADQALRHRGVAGRAGTLEVSLLARPTFTHPLGAIGAPATIARDTFELSYSQPEGAKTFARVLEREGCTTGAWQIELDQATPFRPFELPREAQLGSLLEAEGLTVILASEHTEGELTRTAGLEGYLTFTGELGCAQVGVDWLVGEWVGLTDSMNQCLVDDHRFRITPCGRFEYRTDGGDYYWCQGGEVSVADDANKATLTTHRGNSFGLGKTREVSLAPNKIRGLDALDVRLQGRQELVALRRPDVAAANVPADLVGQYEGITVTQDILQGVSDAPGPVILAGTPVPADGSQAAWGVGSFLLEVRAKGVLEEQEIYPGGIVLRRGGTIMKWDSNAGEVQFQNGPGLCSDYQGIGRLIRLSTDELGLDTLTRIVDVNDLDHDGLTNDTLFRRKRIRLLRK